MGLGTIKTFLMLLLLLKLFSCLFSVFRPIAFYICYKMGRFRLRGLKSKLLINRMIQMHIHCKMGRFRFGGRLRGLKV